MADIPRLYESLREQHLLQLKQESLINRLPFIRQPVVDLEHQVSFVGLVSMTLICFLGTLQGQASENQAYAWEDEFT